jgi:hypothetical protein
MSPSDLSSLEVALTRVEATIVGRIDDLVRRVDGFEKKIDKHQYQINELEKEVYLWKRIAAIVGIIFPLFLKYMVP